MKYKKAYAWSIVGKIAPQAINLLIYAILARYLSPDDFGMVGVLAVFMAISTTLTDSGLGGSLIKEDTITDVDCRTVFSFNLLVSLSLYVIIFFSAGLIERFYNFNGLKELTRILSLAFIVGAFSIVPKSLMIREMKFKAITIISFVSYICAGFIAVLGCLFDWGVYALVAFQLGNIAINSMLINVYSKYSVSVGFNRQSFGRLFSFGAFTTICNIIDSIYENILSILFGKFASISMVGYYDQAKKIETGSASSIATTINTVSFPVLTRLKNVSQDFVKEADSIFAVFAYFIFPILWIISIYSEYIVKLLWGDKWLGASPILSLLMINGVAFICESLVRNNIKSLGYVRSLTNYTIIKRCLSIVIIVISLRVSDFAMLYGLVISTFLGFIINVYLYCIKINISFVHQMIQYIKYAVSPIFVSALCYLVYTFLSDNVILNAITNAVILGCYCYFGLIKYNILNRAI